MQRRSQKSTGEIGSTRLTATLEGLKAEIIHTDLPRQKDELEKFFATPFRDVFNGIRPLEPQVEITNLDQNDENDLDFKIICSAADYLELAELNPRSEEFGREAYRNGKLNVYAYAKWAYHRVIRKKQRKYGELSKRTLLLLYVTHWQFLPSMSVFDCLRSHCNNGGCDFVGVFALITDGRDLRTAETVWPYNGPSLPAPRQYEGRTVTNFPPGQHQWKTDLTK